MRLTQPQIESAVTLVKELAANPAKVLTQQEISLMMDYKNENPHGYEAFFFDGFITYAVNDEAAKNKYLKYCKQKGAENPEGVVSYKTTT